ncbi:MAG: hypothetical protein A3J52_00125 [Omnitrophica bacterium RIFCSPHIGHO2_02_FULL_49_9]|nr:MAG: hypothetical protein A3J52_00125 [Omnitrophica bacterium RIFCSPHIGHO2_02_FULL_49_9]OGW89351.1 MAG: hypothetical protein A3A73_01135 [Omnitrophica bacterium RIFCSPLOWO2_01_FULL_50_24]
MGEQFTVRVETRFEAAHNLRQYKGAEEPLHGHSWRVEAKFSTAKLDHEDIAIDYVSLKDAIRKLGERLDHRYINEIPPFDKINPTSENIARWFFDELNRENIRQNTQLSEVVVWEGPDAFVSYRQD